MRLWEAMKESGIPISPALIKDIVQVHCAHSGSRSALRFLHELRQEGHVGGPTIYNSLLGASETVEEAEEILTEMRNLGYSVLAKSLDLLVAQLSMRLPVTYGPFLRNAT